MTDTTKIISLIPVYMTFLAILSVTVELSLCVVKGGMIKMLIPFIC